MKGQRFSIKPSPALAQTLRQWIGCQRFVYNAKVQDDRYFRRFARKSLQLAGQFAPVDQTYSQYKAQVPFLSEIPSQILRNGAVRWYQAYQRFFKKLGGRPTIKTRHGRQSVYVARELYRFKQSEHGNWYVELGTQTRPTGAVKINCKPGAFIHAPNSICLSVHAGRWFISFALPELGADGEPVLPPEHTELLDELRSYNLEELTNAVNGIDRGVNIPACDSKQVVTTELLTANDARMASRERRRKRYQRKMSRQVKGSRRRERTKLRIARIDRYKASCRTNQAHQVSHRLTTDDSSRVIALEQLNVKGMTASAKGDKENPGRQVKQKAGLNRSILGSGWGELRTYLKYKCFKRGKLLVSVPSHFTSQECSRCGTIDKEARQTQSHYACNACGFQGNADWNASLVIAKHAAWGIHQHLHSGQELSTSGIGKKPKPQTPVELLVSREMLKAYHAQNCETGNPTLNTLKAS